NIQITVERANIPVNPLGADPCLGINCFTTSEINVRVTDKNGRSVTGSDDLNVMMDLSTVNHGYLTRLDDPATDDINEFTGRDEDGNIVARMGQATAPIGAGGIAKFFFTSGALPGST
ncbi:hypothetical protein ECTPHS_13778, partial [Ectothiorhodospira sp. PHS-1]|uniref:hypothetical protein n=1 Tax=Ectothiorhodospira sp. PHS-1 TaxID=519989 RepID=UPI00024A8ACE